ncbi:hypothetical protein Tco_0652734 [Tanacetum coccineum]|uniref:Uncharacterized protein n=1 Tax=Tanacetum coccineum TaxID=301880 RepID=A0ABQ4WYV6_9ASTR
MDMSSSLHLQEERVIFPSSHLYYGPREKKGMKRGSMIKCFAGSSSSKWSSFNEEEIAFLADPGLPDTQNLFRLAKITLMANLSKNGSDALQLRYTMANLDYDLIIKGEHIMTSLNSSNDETVQNSNSSAQEDALILSMFEQLKPK